MNHKFWKYLLGLLLLASVVIWTGVYSSRNASEFFVIACDVGQGDAILIQKGNVQILVDGGPGQKVLDCLARRMPLVDRTIELAVLTHPQQDHYEGLIYVLRDFDVDKMIVSEADNDTQGYTELKKEIEASNVELIEASAGQKLVLGEIKMEIISPLADLETDGKFVLGSFDTTRDLNDFSVVMGITYKDFDILLTGDIGPDVIHRIVSHTRLKDVEYLKVPHHGSKNGLTEELLDAVKPEIAVISAGKSNRFGHPHVEVVKMLEGRGITVYRTDQTGDVVVSQ